MTNEVVLRLERLISGTPEEVFDAWVNPELLVRWWGPEGVTIPQWEMDVRVGGTWTTTMLGGDGSRNVCSGEYREIDRPRKLSFTWAWTQDDGSRGHETVVTVTFQAEDTGTRINLVQQTFALSEQAAAHQGGWSSSFECLEQLFSKIDAE